MNELNIYQRVSAITDELKTVAKNLEIEIVKGKKYSAVSEGDVLRAVKPIEFKHGVYSFPVLREIVESKELVKKTSYGETTSQFMRIKTVYRFVNTDKPGDYFDIVTYGDGVDSQDKTPGKAMTYADKYALLKAYKINTGDDPDAEASEEFVKSTITKPNPKQTEAPVLRGTLSQQQYAELLTYMEQPKISKYIITQLDKNKIKDLDYLSKEGASQLINVIRKRLEQNEQKN